MGSLRIPYQMGLGSREDKTAKKLLKEVGLQVIPKAWEYQNGGRNGKNFPSGGRVWAKAEKHKVISVCRIQGFQCPSSVKYRGEAWRGMVARLQRNTYGMLRSLGFIWKVLESQWRIKWFNILDRSLHCFCKRWIWEAKYQRLAKWLGGWYNTAHHTVSVLG